MRVLSGIIFKFRLTCIFFLSSLILTCASLWFSPYKGNQLLWLNDPSPLLIQWDTGHGYNEIQTESNESKKSKKNMISKIAEKKLLHQEDVFTLIKQFGRFQAPQALRIHSLKPNLKAVIEISSDSLNKNNFQGQKINLSLIKQTSNGYTYTTRFLPPPITPRHFKASLFFILGLTFISALVTGFIGLLTKFSQRPSKEFFFYALSLVLIMLINLWFCYPGFFNPFNPVAIIVMFENYTFAPYDSALLSIIWAALYEVYPSFYLINSVQVMAYLLGLLFLAEKLLQIKWDSKFIFFLLILLVFAPTSFLLHFFLDRNVTNGYVNCLLLTSSFCFLFRQENISMGEVFFLLGLSVLSIGLRLENIFLVLLMTISIFSLKGGEKRLHYLFSVFSFISLYLIGENVLVGQTDWRTEYAVRNTQQTFFSMIKANCDDNKKFFKAEDKELLKNYLHLKKNDRTDFVICEQNIAEEEFRNVSIKSLNEKFLVLYSRMVLKWPDKFLNSRFAMFTQLTLMPYHVYWDYSFKDLYTSQLLLNYPFLQSDFNSGGNGKGIRGIPNIVHDIAKSPLVKLAPQLLITVLCLWLWPLTPVSAFLALSLLIKVSVIFFMAPHSFFVYLYDLHLVGFFLLFTLVFELLPKMRKLRVFNFSNRRSLNEFRLGTK